MKAQINNLTDVKAFARTLLIEGTNFHPDDDFRDYLILDTNKPFYSTQEAVIRNDLMEACFTVCLNEGVDIYDIMLDVTLQETTMGKYIPSPLI